MNKKFNGRSRKNCKAQVYCPKCKKFQITYDLCVNGKCVGIGCSVCFKHLPIVKNIKYKTLK